MGALDFLSAADVMLDVNAKNKGDLLEILAAQAAARVGGGDREILDALNAREALGATALGKGIGLPHARLPGAIPPVVRFARLRHPIDFDAQDAVPVDLVFLVLWPLTEPNGLLNATSEICRVLRDPHLSDQLRLAKAPEEVVRLLQQRAGIGSGPHRSDR